MATLGAWEKSKVHQTAKKVSELETAAESGLHYGATANDLANFPGMMNLVAGSGVSLTPGAGTLTVATTGGGGTVTSVGIIGNDGIAVSGSPVTGSGNITLDLGAITPTSVSTGDLTASGTVSLPAQSITRANLANGSACSVVGRSANSSGVVADISMSTNDRLLGRVSNVVQSTQLTAGMVPNSLITSAMLRNSAGLSVIGRTSGTSGAPADITASGGNQFLKSTSGGTAVVFEALAADALPGGNWIGANNGTAYASSFVALNADSTWFDTGASVSLSAGTYLITYFLHASMAITAGAGTITGRLYNVTAAAPVTDSEVMIVTTNVVGNVMNTGTISLVVTVGGTSTLRGEAQRAAGGTYTGSATRTRSDATGRSGITYVRIA